jgi:hypothetical protein
MTMSGVPAFNCRQHALNLLIQQPPPNPGIFRETVIGETVASIFFFACFSRERVFEERRS